MSSVSSINIELPGGQKVELALEEARQLYASLASLFGAPATAPKDPWPPIKEKGWGDILFGPETKWSTTAPPSTSGRTTSSPYPGEAPQIWCEGDKE